MSYFSLEYENIWYDLINNNLEEEPPKATPIYDLEEDGTRGFYNIEDLIETEPAQSTL